MKTVATSGIFDIITPGHIEFLNKCKKMGDKLIVFLNGDYSASKIKRKPINDQYDRRRVLLGLKAVDEVYIFDNQTPSQMVAAYKPDIYVKDSGYVNKCPEKWYLGQNGVMAFLERDTYYSTTKIIQKIRKRKTVKIKRKY